MTTYPVVRFTVRGVAEEASAGLGRPYTLVYDGMCRMCTRLSNVLKKWDRQRRIEVVPSQATGVMARFPWIPTRAYAEAIQLVGPGGETWQGAAAIEQLLNVLPRGRWIAWIFSIPLVRTVADRVYRWVARYRYRLGCGEHCQARPLDVAFPD
ncbi:MAG: thiol-disulfide oxidoreductase DCC family protein [Gemmatimonadaceae bacterium]